MLGKNCGYFSGLVCRHKYRYKSLHSWHSSPVKDLINGETLLSASTGVGRADQRSQRIITIVYLTAGARRQRVRALPGLFDLTSASIAVMRSKVAELLRRHYLEGCPSRIEPATQDSLVRSLVFYIRYLVQI